MEREKILLEVITPEHTVVQEEDVDIVVFRRIEKETELGSEIGVMPHHAPLLARIPIAPVRYKKSGRTYFLVAAGGFIEIKDNHVIILSPAAEKVVAPDEKIAEVVQKKAEKWLAEMAGRAEFDAKAAEAELKRAMVDLYKSGIERPIGK